ncbi:hypothetical protein BpHYR1_005315 [Brachionus plicatilis]|uniref:Uncharacterized protein n=1 Tax=Brachionus plicatilis TaxID=10195 RepID=A0A3M7QAV1_BRAPC|nr:hypothetical protein BpHYR1_005315 [Brachionus plicatilis]
MARERSTEIDTMVRMDAWATVCSSQGIILQKNLPKYHTSLEKRSRMALGMHTMIKRRSAIDKLTRQ